ncbi:GNAT family N-acetyltransferase [Phytoactinopolyspora halotolerans]|uniref:GNAT family N-acetyltransferase n=1 Tax=Phytoactinopolyspora halotolerans TaxID=1981512 RepID=A0A6L9SBF6_9ACTN|nr:GNAT family N-acetyltransferase [Phytoactinopolyspora halotolerans]NEE02467.1 GNAT family N-acetyltransferase [Phytoactinopolyspora halotolerans]
MEPFELRGDRVLLSAPTTADVDRITELCQDPDIRDWTTVPSPYTRMHGEEFIAQVAEAWAAGTALNWALRDPRDQRPLGMVGLNLDGHGAAEIGFWMAPEYRGQGLVAAAIRLVIERAFAPEGLGLQSMVWRAYVGNWSSRRVVWRLGFAFEGTIRSHLVQRGRRRDAWVATLLPGDPLQPRTPWLDIPTIHGSRLRLRPFVDSDAAAVKEACEDPMTRRWLTLPTPYTLADARGYIDRHAHDAASGRGVTWAAAHPAGGPALGAFTLTLAGVRHDQASLGYWVHPTARGVGIATEAVRLLTRHAFIAADDGGLGLRRVQVTHTEGNDASRAVIERTGFRYSGRQRSAVRLPDGTLADQHWYDLLPEDLI